VFPSKTWEQDKSYPLF